MIICSGFYSYFVCFSLLRVFYSIAFLYRSIQLYRCFILTDACFLFSVILLFTVNKWWWCGLNQCVVLAVVWQHLADSAASDDFLYWQVSLSVSPWARPRHHGQTAPSLRHGNGTVSLMQPNEEYAGSVSWSDVVKGDLNRAVVWFWKVYWPSVFHRSNFRGSERWGAIYIWRCNVIPR